LQFAPVGRLELTNIVKDPLIIHINTCHRIVTLGIRRFLVNIYYLFATYFSNTKTFGIMNFLEQYLCSLVWIISYSLFKGRLKNIVRKYNRHGILTNKIFCQSQGLGNASGFILYFISKATDKIISGSKKVYHIPHMIGAGYHEDLINAGFN